MATVMVVISVSKFSLSTTVLKNWLMTNFVESLELIYNVVTSTNHTGLNKFNF